MNAFENCTLCEFDPECESKIERMDNDEWNDLAIDYRTAKMQVKFLEKQMEEIKKKLIKMINKDICIGNGIELQKITKKGTIDYSKIEELQFVDLEKYRKPATEYWKINDI